MPDLNLIDAFDDLIELRPFPQAANRLITACNDENVTANQISQILGTDPALAVKLLQIANSPVYGHAGQVTSLDHATVIIGLRALKNLAISTAVGDVFAGGAPNSAHVREQLWAHSLHCASIARSLSGFTKLGFPEEAFLAGIVHDVGKLFFTDFRPVEYIQVLNHTNSQTIMRHEQATFGIAHTEVGQRCSRIWGLPDEISDAICFHHAPDDADFASDLIDVVHAANHLAKIWPGKDPEQPCDETSEVFKKLGIDLSPSEITHLRTSTLRDLTVVMGIYGSK